MNSTDATTITVRELADNLETSVEAVQVLVDQLIEVDGEEAVIAARTPLTNSSGRVFGTEVHLTESAAAAVNTALAAAEGAGVDRGPLDDLADAAAEVRDAEHILEMKIAFRDGLIRRALKFGVRPELVIEASGVSRSRVYQIKASEA